MSWKRILRVARHLNAPVIVADEGAKEPLVILPLDAYEGLVGETGGKTGRLTLNQDGQTEDDRMAAIFESAMESLESEDLANFSQKNQKQIAQETSRDIAAESIPEAQIPLEDRYYFEPLEDEPKK